MNLKKFVYLNEKKRKTEFSKTFLQLSLQGKNFIYRASPITRDKRSFQPKWKIFKIRRK